jgi:hypothetical protein
MKNNDRAIANNVNEIVIPLYLLAFIVIGLFQQSPKEILQGLFEIFTHPGMLITDYMVIGGVGAALINGALVGLVGYGILKLNKVPMNGPSIATIFTMVGFGLFGKNVWSILPVILGVRLFCLIRGQSFRGHVYPALFGTALAPMVTQVVFGYEWGIVTGLIVGILSGMIIPPLANHLLIVHEGYNLYNVGFTAGFVGLLFINIFRNYGHDSVIMEIWGTGLNSILRRVFVPMFLSMIIFGIILTKGKLKEYLKVLKHPGILISDYVNMYGFGYTLINMGLVGLIGSVYIELVGGVYNGPTVGGLLTMTGFAAFGKHPANITPIMLGVWLGTKSNLLPYSVMPANAPGALLAALFSTTLAPLAGNFGPIVGILAGFVHLTVVSNVGILHGGLNLYNNGFAGGLVAMFFVAIIKDLKKGR